VQNFTPTDKGARPVTVTGPNYGIVTPELSTRLHSGKLSDYISKLRAEPLTKACVEEDPLHLTLSGILWPGTSVELEDGVLLRNGQKRNWPLEFVDCAMSPALKLIRYVGSDIVIPNTIGIAKINGYKCEVQTFVFAGEEYEVIRSTSIWHRGHDLERTQLVAGILGKAMLRRVHPEDKMPVDGALGAILDNAALGKALLNPNETCFVLDSRSNTMATILHHVDHGAGSIVLGSHREDKPVEAIIVTKPAGSK
jgi:hypothetical protein